MAAEQDTPSSSSSSSSSQPPTTTQPPSSKSPEAKRQLTNLPRLFVVRGPVGLTPSVDERCFTYCSQSVKGRSEGKDPWCRSLCWRRVHKHEVKGNPVPLAPNPTPPRSRVNAESSGPPPSLVNVSTLNGEKDGESDGRKSPETWEEGRYIWYSKGKGSAQVRLEHMRHDVRQMEQWRTAWREKEKKETQEREAKARARARAAQLKEVAAASSTQVTPPPKSLRQIGAENMAAAQVEKRRTAAAAVAAQARQDQATTLIPVASLPSVIRAEFSRRWENLLKPSRLLISTVTTQAAGGSYGRATDKIWQNVTTGQAFKLLDKVARKVEKLGEELDEEDRKAGGNGAQSTK